MRVNDPIYILIKHLDILENIQSCYVRTENKQAISFFFKSKKEDKFPTEVEKEMILILRVKIGALLLTDDSEYKSYMTEENWIGYQMLTIFYHLDRIINAPEVSGNIKSCLADAKDEILRFKVIHEMRP